MQETVIYPYLQPTAISLLKQAREYAAESGILESNILPGQSNSFFIVPWTGTKEISTLAKLLSNGLKQQLEICSAIDWRYYLSVTIGIGADMNFCIRETNIGRMIMKKDSANDERHSKIGGIGITFFPDILKGEPQERISSKDLYYMFNKESTHVTTPLYRTFANLSHALNGKNDISFQYTEKGFLDVFVNVNDGQGFRINLSNYDTEVTLHPHAIGKARMDDELNLKILEMYDKQFGTKFKLLFDEIKRCHEEQMEIGKQFFDEEITEETKKQITFEINEELL